MGGHFFVYSFFRDTGKISKKTEKFVSLKFSQLISKDKKIILFLMAFGFIQYLIFATTALSLVDYFSDMKYFTEKDIDEEKINDYHLIEAARSFGAQNVVTGNAYKYVVPLKYAATTTNMSADVYRINDEDFSNFSNFLGKMGQVFEDTREKASRNNAISSAGVYVNMNLYSINVADNKKKFLSKNKVVLKLD